MMVSRVSCLSALASCLLLRSIMRKIFKKIKKKKKRKREILPKSAACAPTKHETPPTLNMPRLLPSQHTTLCTTATTTVTVNSGRRKEVTSHQRCQIKKQKSGAPTPYIQSLGVRTRLYLSSSQPLPQTPPPITPSSTYSKMQT